jgi:L-asparaginase II
MEASEINVSAISAPTGSDRGRSAAARPRRTVPPVLVRQIRNGVEETAHRGDIAEVDVGGRMLRAIGDPDVLVNLRSAVKPFALVALIEAGGIEEFELEQAELAIMAGSHSGEDLHVRTLQALFRRTNVSQAGLRLGSEGMPLDALTAARLARDGERPGDIRHMCSGQHATFLLLARLRGWPVEEYWLDDHPTQVAVAEVVARAFGTTPGKLRTGYDGCGIPTYAFPLRDVARAYAFLANPEAVRSDDARASLAPFLVTVRDAMLANPEMVAGSRDRLDTSVMKALPGRIVAKGGAEGLRAYAILPGPRARSGASNASGLALKIEDGGQVARGPEVASVEALAQAGVLDGQALRVLGRYHQPTTTDVHGREAAEAIASFELAPVGELLG